MPSSISDLPTSETTSKHSSLEKRKNLRSIPSHNMRRPSIQTMGTMNLVTVIACSLCLIACLLPARPVECGRLQDFIQNLVGGGSNSNSNSNNNKENSNSNSNSNSNNNNNDNSDSDTAASNDNNDQPMTPMMSAMSPFMRYPSFYDSFGPAGFGGFPGMSFSNPMGAMSAMSPMAAMSGSSLSSAFSPASFGPAAAAFGSYGSTSGNPMSAFSQPNGMSASTLNNVYASSPNLLGSYAQYYGKKRR